MAKRVTDTDIWKKDWFLNLTDKQKLLVKFLFDNCDCAGVYEISQKILNACFNEQITRVDFEAIKQVRFIKEDVIFLEDFIKYQYNVEISELNEKYNLHKGILRRLNKYGISSTLPLGYISTLQEQKQEQYKEKEKEKEKDKYKDNTISKQIDTYINNNENLKNYGEYLNVTLTSEQYGKLLAMCASQKMLDKMLDDFSANIEIGKEEPFKAELPNAHFERLKRYYNYRKQNPDKFIEEKKADEPYMPWL